jgi:hypothetical protein
MRMCLAIGVLFLAAEPAPERPRAPHPEPRVIVNVLAVRGGHQREDLERAARLAWGRIVRCYKSLDGRANGMIGLELLVASSGRISDVRQTRSTLKNSELAGCLMNTLKGVTVPRAERNSTADAEIHVAPGDPPDEKSQSF